MLHPPNDEPPYLQRLRWTVANSDPGLLRDDVAHLLAERDQLAALLRLCSPTNPYLITEEERC